MRRILLDGFKCMDVLVIFLGLAVLAFYIFSGYLAWFVIKGSPGDGESVLTRLVTAMIAWFNGLVVLLALYFLTSFVDAANNCSEYLSCQVQFTLENLREQRWSFFWGGAFSLVAAILFASMGRRLARKFSGGIEG